MSLTELQLTTVRVLIERVLCFPSAFSSAESEYIALITPFLALNKRTLSKDTADSLRYFFTIDLARCRLEERSPLHSEELFSQFCNLLSDNGVCASRC